MLPSPAVVKDPILCPFALVRVTIHPDIGPSSMMPRAETGICSKGITFPEDCASHPHPQPHPPPHEMRDHASKRGANLFIKTDDKI
jgi:hypothetical protein